MRAYCHGNVLQRMSEKGTIYVVLLIKRTIYAYTYFLFYKIFIQYSCLDVINNVFPCLSDTPR